MFRLRHLLLILLLWAPVRMVWAQADAAQTLLASADDLAQPGTAQLSMPYPNPATEQTALRYELNGSFQQVHLRVYDMLGKQVTAIALTHNTGEVQLPVRALRNGIYFCSLEADGKTLATRKLVVSR